MSDILLTAMAEDYANKKLEEFIDEYNGPECQERTQKGRREIIQRYFMFAFMEGHNAGMIRGKKLGEFNNQKKERKVETQVVTNETKPEGAFVSSLKRNNRQIRSDRAAAIAEDAQLIYKRQIEDLEVSIKKMRREQENMLDLSPSDATSLMLASDFDSASYAKKDVELGVKIRNSQIKLDIAKSRYTHLFGGV